MLARPARLPHQPRAEHPPGRFAGATAARPRGARSVPCPFDRGGHFRPRARRALLRVRSKRRVEMQPRPGLTLTCIVVQGATEFTAPGDRPLGKGCGSLRRPQSFQGQTGHVSQRKRGSRQLGQIRALGRGGRAGGTSTTPLTARAGRLEGRGPTQSLKRARREQPGAGACSAVPGSGRVVSIGPS